MIYQVSNKPIIREYVNIYVKTSDYIMIFISSPVFFNLDLRIIYVND